jgi:hypothetical protein
MFVAITPMYTHHNTHTHTHIHMCTNTHTHIHISFVTITPRHTHHIHTHTHTYVKHTNHHIHTHTHTYVKHTHTHTHLVSRHHSKIHSSITYTCIQTHTHTHTPGFVAITPEGVPTTLKRSGSDFSATIFARLVGASRVTMWKNTDGKHLPAKLWSVTFSQALMTLFGIYLHCADPLCLYCRSPVTLF